MSTSGMMPLVEKTVLSEAQQALLSRRIGELGLKIEGTPLEPLIAELYVELERAGLGFKPKCYLADEWGCPQGVPVIGIPFYLASRELSELEGLLTSVEAETEEETLMYLRHEAGHAFNYAYRLYAKREWRRLFGRYSQPYRDDYKPSPFCARFVRHIPGWYAQKHPDEDFAETFAVWLAPGSDWQRRYADAPALAKLTYIQRVARRYGHQTPVVTDETKDAPVESLTMTLAEWYGMSGGAETTACELPQVLNEDLRAVFPAEKGQPAIDVLRPLRGPLLEDLYRWTGLNRRLLRALVDDLFRRVDALGLKIEPESADARLISLATLTATLAMNYRYTDRFVRL